MLDHIQVKWQLISQKMNVCFQTKFFKVHFEPVLIKSYEMFMHSSGVSLCFLNKGATSFCNSGPRSLSSAFLRTSPPGSGYHLCRATRAQYRKPLCIGLSHGSSCGHWQKRPPEESLSFPTEHKGFILH